MIKFTCPSCSHNMLVKDEYAGKKAKCSKCQAVGKIPDLAQTAAPKAPPPSSEDDGGWNLAKALAEGEQHSPKAETSDDVGLKPITKACPYCGADIPEDAKKCKHCGEWIVAKPQSQVISPRRRANEDGSTGLGSFAKLLIKLAVVGALIVGAVFAFPFIKQAFTTVKGGRTTSTQPADSIANVNTSNDKPVASRVKIHGSAWITLKSGDSQIIRGMRVYVLGPNVSSTSQAWEPVAKKLAGGIGWFKKLASNDGVGADMQRIAAEQLQKSERMMQRIAEMRTKDQLPTNHAYMVIRGSLILASDRPGSGSTGSVIQEDNTWASLMSTAQVCSVYTDAGGKFEMTTVTPAIVPEGSFLYAAHSTSVELIEWLVPLEKANNGEIKVDLFNENVFRSFSMQQD